MAIWTFPLKSINGSNMYSDKDFRRFYANIFSSGIIPNVDLEGNLSLQVLQTETSSMNIRVGPGVDMINGGHIMNTDFKEFSVPAPLTTQERIDCIVAQWNDSTNSGDIIYKKNTTQIIRSQDIWEHKLAEIVVPANASSISQINIKDTRADPEVCGYSSPFEQIDVGDIAAQFRALTDSYSLEFQAWFQNLKNQLDDNQAANLQNQIDAINGVIVQKEIPEGANLDDYKTEGDFAKASAPVVSGTPNGVTGAFRLSVRTMLGSTAFYQTLYDYATAAMYIRFANFSGWKPWQKVGTDVEDFPWTDLKPGTGVLVPSDATLKYRIKSGYITIVASNVQTTIDSNGQKLLTTLPLSLFSKLTHVATIFTGNTTDPWRAGITGTNLYVFGGAGIRSNYVSFSVTLPIN